MTARPFSQACENNKGPILEVLRRHLDRPGRLLEIGAGTGQHAAFLGRHLSHIHWQPSDVAASLPGIRLWLEDTPANVAPPLALDVEGPWPAEVFDYLFTANTLHIMAPDTGLRLFAGAAQHLRTGGLLLIYGPFNIGGTFTADSNLALDAALRARAPHMGIRDLEWVDASLAREGLTRIAEHAMPANNRLLVYRRDAQ